MHNKNIKISRKLIHPPECLWLFTVEVSTDGDEWRNGDEPGRKAEVEMKDGEISEEMEKCSDTRIALISIWSSCTQTHASCEGKPTLWRENVSVNK